MNVESVKKALLAAAGNPESGVLVDIADVLSEAIVKAHTPEKEVRVVEVKETR